MAGNFEVMSVKLNAVRMYWKLRTPHYTLQSLIASGYKIKQWTEQWQRKFVPQNLHGPGIPTTAYPLSTQHQEF